MQNSLIGGLYLVLLFVLCVAAVYITKAVFLLINFTQKSAPQEVEVSKISRPKPQVPKSQEVYYIVERKKRLPKNTRTCAPRQIHFNNQNQA